MMDVHEIYCHHFMMFVNQIIMLYTLNLYSAANCISIKLKEKVQKNEAIKRIMENYID